MAVVTNDAIFLGNFADADTVEGTLALETPSIYQQNFGSAGSPLYLDIVDLSFDDANNDGIIFRDNSGGEDISYDLGAGTVVTRLDSIVRVDMTVTYSDGTTQALTDVIMFQDQLGNLFAQNSTLASSDLDGPNNLLIQSINVTAVDNATGYDRVDDFAALADIAGPVDGAATGENMGVGYTDADNDQITNTADVIYGNGGNDTIDSGGGNDSVFGGTGDDTLYGGTGEDRLEGGAGFDTIFGGTENDTIILGSDDSIQGGSGLDLIDGSASGAPVSVLFSSGTVGAYGLGNGTSFQSVEMFISGGGDDVYDVSAATSFIYIFAGGGADTIDSGSASDSLDGGAGNDSIAGNGGDDSISGGDGNDSLFGGAGNDGIDGGAGSDFIDGGSGFDLLIGGGGNDTLLGGTDDDTIRIGDGYLGTSIDGGSDVDGLDIDTLDASDVTSTGVVITLSGPESGNVVSSEGTANFVEIENFVLTNQADTFNGNFAPEDMTVDGGGGNDTIVGGARDNTLYGGDGDDTFTVGIGNDFVFGGAGTDTIIADDPIELTFTGDGQGTFDDFGDPDNGTFEGIEVIQGSVGGDAINAGADTSGVTLFGNSGDDTITGGSGRDTLDGGDGVDTLTGGSGPDVFVADGTADTITDFDTTTGIDGGANTDNDFVDLSGFYNAGTLATWNANNPGQTYTTALGWMRADQADNGQLDEAGGLRVQNGGTAVTASEMNAENTGVVCFTEGTMIKTTRGEVPVENLRLGDLVQTMDSGLQPIRWIGKRRVSHTELTLNPKLRPVRIRKAAFGGTGQDRDLIVSPQHRILVVSKVADRMFGTHEVLIPALKLLPLNTVEIADDLNGVTYFHILFDRHEIIFANDVPAESLYLGTEALHSLSPDGRAEIQALFPEVLTDHFAASRCRTFVAGKRANRLAARLAKNRKTLVEKIPSDRSGDPDP